MCLYMPLSKTGPGLKEAASTPSVDNLRSLLLNGLQELHEQCFRECVKNVFKTRIGMVMWLQHPLEGGKLNTLWDVQWLLSYKLVVVSIFHALQNSLWVVLNQRTEQHWILALVVQLVLYLNSIRQIITTVGNLSLQGWSSAVNLVDKFVSYVAINNCMLFMSEE